MKKFNSLVAVLSFKSLGVLICPRVLRSNTTQKIFYFIFPLVHGARIQITLEKSISKTAFNYLADSI